MYFGGIGPDFARLIHRFAVIQSSPPSFGGCSANPSPIVDPLDDLCLSSPDWVLGPSSGVRYSWLTKDFIHQIALATLMRLRGRDGLVSPSLVPSDGVSPVLDPLPPSSGSPALVDPLPS